MRKQVLLATTVLALGSQATSACQLAFPREPTLPEKLAGETLIFGGTVVGYVVNGGALISEPPPPQCLDEQGDFWWWGEIDKAACAEYMDVSAALFRVDTTVVGAEAGEIVDIHMSWGDGDCNTDFNFGEQWLVAGWLVAEQLRAPIRADEVATLRRLAARPKVDLTKLD